MTYIEGDKLIADFIGINVKEWIHKEYEGYSGLTIIDDGVEAGEWQPSGCWDQLIPACKQFDELCMSWNEEYNIRLRDLYTSIVSLDISRAWECLVDNIKWYLSEE